MKRSQRIGGVLLSTVLLLASDFSVPADAAAGVKSTDNVSESAAASGRGITVARESEGTLIFDDYEAPSTAAAAAFVAKVSDDEGVAGASINQPQKALTNDFYWSSQWDMQKLDVEGAHNIANGSGQVVAVIDTGVDGGHADLAGQVLPGIDLVAGGDGRNDPHGHGSHVAGSIAALTNNGRGIASVAPGARILPVRVLDSTGAGYDNVISNGIVWAADHGATVINLSLGGAAYSSVEEAAVNYAVSKGVFVVAAAGNSGNAGNPVMYPAGFPNAFSVAASTQSNTIAPWSEYNAFVDIAAPGDSIISTVPGGYSWKSGTSMASPHVAAVAALVLSRTPNLNIAQLRGRLESTAMDMGPMGRDDYSGAGLVNPIGALTSNVVTSPNNAPNLPSRPTGAWTTAGDGGVFSFSGAQFFGSTGNISLNQPIVGMSTTGTGAGYRFVAADGGVFNYGDANFYGSMGDKALNKPIVGMAATPSGNGYWMVASDGGVFAFGDANFYGSTGNIALNKPIVGMSSTPTGRGYWMVASDGGIFAFGDARFYGSAGGYSLSAPITGMAATPSGGGYYLVSRSGSVYTFGDALYKGGLATDNVVGVAASPNGAGYAMASADGSIASFGDAAALVGTSGRMRLNRPVVGISLVAK